MNVQEPLSRSVPVAAIRRDFCPRLGPVASVEAPMLRPFGSLQLEAGFVRFELLSSVLTPLPRVKKSQPSCGSVTPRWQVAVSYTLSVGAAPFLSSFHPPQEADHVCLPEPLLPRSWLSQLAMLCPLGHSTTALLTDGWPASLSSFSPRGRSQEANLTKKDAI